MAMSLLGKAENALVNSLQGSVATRDAQQQARVSHTATM